MRKLVQPPVQGCRTFLPCWNFKFFNAKTASVPAQVMKRLATVWQKAFELKAQSHDRNAQITA